MTELRRFQPGEMDAFAALECSRNALFAIQRGDPLATIQAVGDTAADNLRFAAGFMEDINPVLEESREKVQFLRDTLSRAKRRMLGTTSREGATKSIEAIREFNSLEICHGQPECALGP